MTAIDTRFERGRPGAVPRAAALPRDQRIGRPVLALSMLLTTYFVVLPLGRYSVGAVATDFRLFDFAFALFAVIYGIPHLRDLARLRRGYKSYLRWAVRLGVLVCLSLVITGVTGGLDRLLPGIIRAARFCSFLLVGIFVALFVDTERRWRFLYLVFAANVAVQGAIAFLQQFDLLPPLWPDYWLRAYDNATPVATLSPHHKHIAIVMVLGLSVGATLMSAGWSVRLRAAGGAILVLSAGALLFSGARSGWLAAAGAFLAYLWYNRRGGLTSGLGAVAGVVAIALVLVMTAQSAVEEQVDARVVDRIQTYGLRGITQDRENVYSSIPAGVLGRPYVLVVGTGFQNVDEVVAGTGAHNNFLQAWLELGIVGFVVYLMFLRRILDNLGTAARVGRTRFMRTAARNTRAAFVGVIVSMLVGETLWGQYSMFTLSGQIVALVALGIQPMRLAMASSADRGREPATT